MVKISVGIRNVKFVLILSFLAGVKKERGSGGESLHLCAVLEQLSTYEGFSQTNLEDFTRQFVLAKDI